MSVLIADAELEEVRALTRERIAKSASFRDQIKRRQADQRSNLVVARASKGEHAARALPLLEALVEHDHSLLIFLDQVVRDLTEKLKAAR